MLHREAHIDRQLVSVTEGRSNFGPLKTVAAVRTIPLPQVVVDALAAHLAAHPPADGGHVLTINGEPITRQAFGHIWRPIAHEVGLPLGTGLHMLRHYYASL